MVALTGASGKPPKGLEIPIISELTLPSPWFGGGLNPYQDMGGLKFFAQDAFNTSYNLGFLWSPSVGCPSAASIRAKPTPT